MTCSIRLQTASLLALGLVATGARAEDFDVPSVATPTISSAVLAASDGDTIIVQPRDADAEFPFDAYYEAIDLAGKDLTIRSVDPTDPDIVARTVIDATGQNTSVVTSTDGEAALLDGLTLTGGVALGGGGSDRGGALNVRFGSTTVVRRCVITGNSATFGGGVYSDAAAPVFEDCRFTDNHAIGDGSGNSGTGGAIYSNDDVNCTRCVFDLNTAQHQGGAVFQFGDTGAYTDCEFTDNTSTGNGGGLSIVGAGSPLLIRCRISGNHAGGRGGGLYAVTNGTAPQLRNCVIDDNTATGEGGGVAADGSADPVLTYCTIAGNEASSGGGVWGGSSAAVVAVTNTIVWGNTPDGISAAGAIVQHSNDQTGVADSTNISANPLFVDLDAGDLRLSEGSPSIDRGDSTVLQGPSPVDFAGGPRALDDPASPNLGLPIYDLTVDMGAYEFQPDGPIPTCPGDANGDGLVNVGDLIEVITNWGVCP